MLKLRVIHANAVVTIPIVNPTGTPVAPFTPQHAGVVPFTEVNSPTKIEPSLFLADCDRGLRKGPGSRDRFRSQGTGKQPVYIPFQRVGPTKQVTPGFVDLVFSDRVELSFNSGVIANLVADGQATDISYDDSVLAAPVITVANINVPTPGDLTITGLNLDSLAPITSKVFITGTGGPFTFTKAQILAGLGTFSNTSIFIPAAMVPGIVAATTFAQVEADEQLSLVVALS